MIIQYVFYIISIKYNIIWTFSDLLNQRLLQRFASGAVRIDAAYSPYRRVDLSTNKGLDYMRRVEKIEDIIKNTFRD